MEISSPANEKKDKQCKRTRRMAVPQEAIGRDRMTMDARRGGQWRPSLPGYADHGAMNYHLRGECIANVIESVGYYGCARRKCKEKIAETAHTERASFSKDECTFKSARLTETFLSLLLPLREALPPHVNLPSVCVWDCK
jgi:hypothetical protein